jgi:hypothetical protein
MANVIVNGNFSAGIANWNLTTPTATIDATGGLGGSPCALFDASNERIQQNFPVVSGQQYTLSLWIRFSGFLSTAEIQVRNTTSNALLINTSIGANNLNVWRNYTFSFTPTGTTQCSLRVRNTGFLILIFRADDISVIPFIICYRGDSKVISKHLGTGRITERPVEIINPDYQVYDLERGKFVPVVMNIVSGPVKSIWKILKNSLEEGVPSEDFYITGGHRLVLGGKEVKVRDLPQAMRVSIKPAPVYSLVCPIRTSILINNTPTIVYGESDVADIMKSNELSTVD